MSNLIEIEERVSNFWITLNRPEKRNALNRQLLRELSDTLEEIKEDKSIRTVILRGAGDEAFCAGADISMLREMDAYEAFMFSQSNQRIFNKIEEFPKPVIASIDGFALGGGLELAMACDLRIASRNAKFGQPEINLGIFPGSGGTQRLVKLVGVGKAKEMLMLGEVISAEEAKEIGLIHEVVPRKELKEKTKKIAEKLSKKPPIALALLKHITKYGGNMPPSVGEKLESLGFGAIFSTDDAKRGLESFLKGEETEFKGE